MTLEQHYQEYKNFAETNGFSVLSFEDFCVNFNALTAYLNPK